VEGSLWAGYPEPSNGSYGVAKRTLMDLLGAYHQQYGLSYSVPILANLYGPGDTYKPEKSHVISDLFYKFGVAKEKDEATVEVWGNGSATRDFLFVQDAVEALVLAGRRENVGEMYNVASGEETTIYSLAHAIKRITGFQGEIVWGEGKPTGQERRAFQLYQVKKILGWGPKVKLEEGLNLYYNWLGGKNGGS
jgi:GDP-L-fucose synthase